MVDRQLLNEASEAQRRQDWVEAERLWREITQQAPEQASGYLGLGEALRRQNRNGEAVSLLRRASALFPEHAAVHIDYATVVGLHGDVPLALRLWQDARDRFPGRPQILIGLAQAYRDAGQTQAADSLLAEACAQLPDNAGLLFEYARIAEAAGDSAAAIARWTDAQQRWPGHREPIINLGRLLRLAARYDEADAVLASDPALLAGSWDILCEWALVAQGRRDWSSAAERWQQATRTFPTRPTGYAELAFALWLADRAEEAEAITTGALANFPNDARLYAMHARLAHVRRDLAEALERWRRVAQLNPRSAEAARYQAEILRESGQTAAAEAFLAEAVERLPDSVDVAEQHAAVPHQRGDREEALRRWQRIARHHPDHGVVLRGMAEVLMELHRLDEAEPVLAHLRAVAPADFRGMTMQARLLTIRGDWRSALKLLNEARTIAPLDPQVLAALNLARVAAMDDPDGGPEAVPEAEPGQGESGQPWQGLMLGFEGLGDNCEFGMVQRYYGAEPIGLLRWAAIMPAQLRDGLVEGFSRLSDPDDFFLDDAATYYASRSRAYGLPINTYVPLNAANPAVLAPKVRRRLLFMRRKLIEEFEAGDKIFVYKSMLDLSNEEALALHEALQKYGPNRLLVVRRAKTGGKPGEAYLLRPGLAIGHIERYGNEGGGWDVEWQNWLAVCRAAVELLPVQARQ